MVGCNSLDKIDIKRKDFSALKSGRVQKKQKILTDVPSNKVFFSEYVLKYCYAIMDSLQPEASITTTFFKEECVL